MFRFEAVLRGRSCALPRFIPTGGLEVAENWGHHTVVIRDELVFDQWHPEGIGVDDFKALWDYGEFIEFGF